MATSQKFYFENIGTILLQKDLLSKEQVSIILKSQKTNNTLFGQLAVRLGFLSENDLLAILSEIYCIEPISLEFLYIDHEILCSLTYDIMTSCMAIPFFIDYKTVKIAISDPGNLRAIDKIHQFFADRKIEFFLAKESEILRYLEIIKCNAADIEQDPLLLLNKIIFKAIESRASDIHFEPSENFVNVRLRVDSILYAMQSITLESWKTIKSKLKIISKLDIAESRLPQSGHARIYLAGKTVDLRISTHPDRCGEKLAIRIFDLSYGIKSLTDLGFSNEDFLWLKKIISFPSGLFLIVGPTGSGKTTTLYSLLKEINSSNLNIMTLEDPIEYQIDGIKQLELREDGLLSFADGVRSILRQDPDVMLIGEIRDAETAATAVRASLTGRLVLATLHAATPLEGLRRLMDLGLNLSDFVPSLIGIFSQRLVRFLKNNDSENKYHGRFPITEYIYFSEEAKKKLLETKNMSGCKVSKTFEISVENALKNKLTDLDEIKRILGDASI